MIELVRENPAAAHWSQQQYEGLFQETGSEEFARFAWIIEGESNESKEPASGSPKVLGFLVGRRVDAQWELENIVVAQHMRRRGLGGLLLREFIAHARDAGAANILLEVRQSNVAARAFYLKFGFAEAGSRKSYYSMPAEDAVLYRLTIG